MSTSSNLKLEAALSYAKRGWRVFPLAWRLPNGKCSCGRSHPDKDTGKHPIINDWPALATFNANQIETWWAETPEANIAIATGIGSGIIVLDVDGEQGEKSLEIEENKYEKIPATTQVETGRGRHLYFIYPDGYDIGNNAGLLGPSLDIRANGGYVVAAASIHSSGKIYFFTENCPQIPIPLPEWVLGRISKKAPRRNNVVTERGLSRTIGAGQRNQAMASLAGCLRRINLEYPEILAGLKESNIQRCKPPLDEKEIETIARSIATKDPSRFNPFGVEDTDELVVDRGNEMKPVLWRWHGFLPLNTLILWAGDPGQGKSTVAYDLAARITRGSSMPFTNGDVEKFDPAHVLILAGEDDAIHVVNPRMTLAGADPKYKIFVSPITKNGKTISLPDHVPHLKRLMDEFKPKLVIIDPLNAFVGVSVDSHKDAEMRHSVTQPLASLAEEYDATILAIAHLNKSATTSAFYRVGGSIALVGAPRAVFLFGDDEEEEGLHAFMCLKNNYARKPNSLLYTIEEKVISGVGPTSYIKWQRESTAHSAEAVLEKGPRYEARLFLKNELTDGPRSSDELIKAAKKVGIAKATLDRAKKDLGIKSIKKDDQWFMALPEYKRGDIIQESLLPTEEL